MPDLNHSIAQHQKEMALWWKRPEYIKARKEFCKRNPICVRCGRKCTTPGHAAEDYHSFETYLSAVTRDKCDPLCNGCNHAEQNGKKACPVCVRENKGGKPWYIGQEQEYCFIHRPAEEVKRSEDRKEVHKWLVKQSQKITNAKKRAIYQTLKEKKRK